MSIPSLPPAQEFGPLIGPWNVQQAAVGTLTTWLWPTYTEELERQNGLLQGTLNQPGAIRGAADDQEWSADEFPAVAVICMNPEGEPERFGGQDGTTGAYRLILGVIVGAEDEWAARRDASLYAQAVMGAIDQQLADDNPTLVQDVSIAELPSVELLNPEMRRFWVGRVEFNVYVAPAVIDTLGPAEPLASGELPGTWPVVTTTDNITVVTEPLSDDLP